LQSKPVSACYPCQFDSMQSFESFIAAFSVGKGIEVALIKKGSAAIRRRAVKCPGDMVIGNRYLAIMTKRNSGVVAFLLFQHYQMEQPLIRKSKLLLIDRYCYRDILPKETVRSTRAFANVIQYVSGQFGCAACIVCGMEFELNLPRLRSLRSIALWCC